MLEVLNTTSTTLTASQTIPLGNVSAKSNQNATLNGDSIQINSQGYYDVVGQFVIEGTSASVVTVQMYVNGTAISGAMRVKQ